MSWILTLIFLLFVINHYHPCDARSSRNKKVPSALVVGSVYCDTCFQNDFSKTSHFISGASVAVECNAANSKTFRKEVQTNKHGQFKVALPLSISKHVKKIEGCSVKLIRSSDPYCSVASTATSTTSLHLKSRKPGTHIFSAGFFTFKPLTQPTICNQKPSPLTNSENTPNLDNSFPPPLQDPPSSIIPPIDNPGQFQPIPILPRLPPWPQIPNLPDLPKTPIFPPKPKNNDFSNKKSFVFPPNPFQPPLVPNPLQPPLLPNPLQPPPSIFPPIFPSPPSTFPPIFPSPPSIFPPIFPSPPQQSFPPIFPAPPSPPSFFPPIPLFPPVPFLTPPPSPPPPAFPLIPPFPFQPAPRFPGVPPAASLAGSKGSGP